VLQCYTPFPNGWFIIVLPTLLLFTALIRAGLSTRTWQASRGIPKEILSEKKELFVADFNPSEKQLILVFTVILDQRMFESTSILQYLRGRS